MIKDGSYTHIHHQSLDLWDHLKDNPMELLKFISAAHAVAFEDEYRDNGLVGTCEYLAKAIPELQSHFKEAPKKIQNLAEVNNA